MSTLRTPVAAAARASSRRGSGLVHSRGGAGRGLVLLSSGGGAGLRPLPFAGVRGFSNKPPEKLPFWSWENLRAKVDELHNAISSAHGVMYILSTSSAGFAVYYVDRAIGEERRSREGFERSAVKGHQDHVEHTIINIEQLKEKMGNFWDRFLSYREDDLQYRDVVTKSADLLKKKGYIVLPAPDFEEMKSQIVELTSSMAEINELKEKIALFLVGQEEKAANSLKECNEKGFNGTFKEEVADVLKEGSNEGEFDGTEKKKPSVSGKEHGPGDAQSAVSDSNAVKKPSVSGKKNGPGDGDAGTGAV